MHCLRAEFSFNRKFDPVDFQILLYLVSLKNISSAPESERFGDHILVRPRKAEIFNCNIHLLPVRSGSQHRILHFFDMGVHSGLCLLPVHAGYIYSTDFYTFRYDLALRGHKRNFGSCASFRNICILIRGTVRCGGFRSISAFCLFCDRGFLCGHSFARHIAVRSVFCHNRFDFRLCFFRLNNLIFLNDLFSLNDILCHFSFGSHCRRYKAQDHNDSQNDRDDPDNDSLRIFIHHIPSLPFRKRCSCKAS